MGKRRLWLVVVLIQLAASSVRAENPPPSDAAKEQAKALYEQSMIHYRLGEYDRAIELSKQGYRLASEPDFLFNIAQAYRLKKDCEQALVFYRSYVREEPNPQNREEARARIGDMEKCVAQTNASRPAPAPSAPVDVAPAPRGHAWLPWVFIGAGTAVALTGGILLASALSDFDDAKRSCGGQCLPSDPLVARSKDDQSQATVSYVLLGLGGAAVATGVVLHFWGQPSRATTGYVAPTLGGVVVGGQF